MLSRPAVRDPSWYSPTGFRIAYLSRHELRVVAGDGTGDHLVATGIASVAPAWESGHPYDLAYVAGRRQVVVRDTATGAVRWRVTPRDRPLALSWSDDGTELMVAARHHVSVYGQSGRLLLALPSAGREPVHDAALSPDGHTLAVLAGGDSQALDVIPLRGRPSRQLLSGEGLGALSWSPDGRWLLVSWPAADQWVFVRVHGGPRILAVSHIRRQLASGEATFPRVDGWCCAGPSH
jgi:Tol biopolymer transport system component